MSYLSKAPNSPPDDVIKYCRDKRAAYKRPRRGAHRRLAPDDSVGQADASQASEPIPGRRPGRDSGIPARMRAKRPYGYGRSTCSYDDPVV